MLQFENDIVKLFQKNGVLYDFDESRHFLSSNKLQIQFQPNISKAKSTDRYSSDSQSINLWEDIYLSKTELVISRINSLLGSNNRIYGRETTVESIDFENYSYFLDQHHLMGQTKSKHRLGLFYKDELVAVAGFGRECPIDHEGKRYRSYELIRFCSKASTTIVGGLSKLIDSFRNSQKAEHLMTYVDREWSNGANYEKIGFRKVGMTPVHDFLISPLDGSRYRKEELKKKDINSQNWQSVVNLGSHKMVKIFNKEI